MEESDVNSLCTISLARFKREDKLKFATEYQEANEEDSAEQFWISEDEDDDSDETEESEEQSNEEDELVIDELGSELSEESYEYDNPPLEKVMRSEEPNI